MMSSLDELIRRAIEEGKFSNLPGEGKPLRLDDNPFEDPDWRLAYHVLRSSGFSLPWIERRNAIESELQAARAALHRAYVWRQVSIARDGSSAEVDAGWVRAVDAFRASLTELNKKILAYNLEAPSDRFQLRLLNADRELELTTFIPSDTLNDNHPD